MALILDNASIHHAKALRTFAERHPEVKFFHLAPYSPEYNPIEQVWHWLKPLVHAAKTINGGISELLSRVRKVMHVGKNQRTLGNASQCRAGYLEFIDIEIYATMLISTAEAVTMDSLTGMSVSCGRAMNWGTFISPHGITGSSRNRFLLQPIKFHL